MAHLKIDKSTSLDLQNLLSLSSMGFMLLALIGISVCAIHDFFHAGFHLFFRSPQSLGDYLHSSLAILYNLSILAASIGALLTSLCLALLKLNNYFLLIAIIAMLSGISLLLQGIYPVNYAIINNSAYYAWLILSILLFLLTFISYLSQQRLIGGYVFIFAAISLFLGIFLVGQFNFNQFNLPQCNTDSPHLCALSIIMWLYFQLSLWWFVIISYKCRQFAISGYQRHARSQLYG